MPGEGEAWKVHRASQFFVFVTLTITWLFGNRIGSFEYCRIRVGLGGMVIAQLFKRANKHEQNNVGKDDGGMLGVELWLCGYTI